MIEIDVNDMELYKFTNYIYIYMCVCVCKNSNRRLLYHSVSSKLDVGVSINILNQIHLIAIGISSVRDLGPLPGQWPVLAWEFQWQLSETIGQIKYVVMLFTYLLRIRKETVVGHYSSIIHTMKYSSQR